MEQHMNMRLHIVVMALLILLVAPRIWAQEEPVEITVMGRQPGPPMWLVKQDEHELWIFTSLSPIPKDMIWESDKVAAVIARSQEYIMPPDIGLDASPLLYLNPINIVRGMRLASRLSKNEAGDSLEEVLPAALYARFSALKTQYFPKNKKIEKLRPVAAGGQMMQEIQQQSGLVSNKEVIKQIRRLLKRNKNIKQTSVEVKMEITGSYKSLAQRAENLMGSIAPEAEIACFETQLKRMETDIREMQLRADSWARGYIDEFKGIPLPGDNDDPCAALVVNSTEQETIAQLLNEVNSQWLAAVKTALATNQTTFAILNITELLREDGLLVQLRNSGYEVIEP